ncbi:MAG: hypothetical protein EOP81_00135 [Variovorax sp.]|nr:MAG: hypothetical protein EOP81_00135 [Variovorax sp.]
MTDPIVSALLAAATALLGAFIAQFVAEKYRRFHDGSAVAAGILGELSAYRGGAEVLAPRIRGWMTAASSDLHLTFRPIERPVDLFFDASVGKLGLLGHQLTEHTVYVYANLRAFRIGLEVITTAHAEMTKAEFLERCELCLQSLKRCAPEGRSSSRTCGHAAT